MWLCMYNMHRRDDVGYGYICMADPDINCDNTALNKKPVHCKNDTVYQLHTGHLKCNHTDVYSDKYTHCLYWLWIHGMESLGINELICPITYSGVDRDRAVRWGCVSPHISRMNLKFGQNKDQ